MFWVSRKNTIEKNLSFCVQKGGNQLLVSPSILLALLFLFQSDWRTSSRLSDLHALQ